MKIYLFRHGETAWNRERRLQGQSDVPLNDFGRKLAMETAEALKEVAFDRAFSSPLRRASETAALILGKRKVSLVQDDRLKEICFGSYEGHAFDEMKRDKGHPIYDFLCRPEGYMPPEGAESLGETRDRARSFLQEQIVPLEGVCENVLIVAHGAFNRSMLGIIADIPPKDFWKISLPNCAASILSLEGGCFAVLEESKIYYERPVNGRP